MNEFSNTKIDSLSISYDFYKVELKEGSHLGNIVLEVVEGTGEQIGRKTKTKQEVSVLQNVKTILEKKDFTSSNLKNLTVNKTFIRHTITAKYLGSNYFEGVNMSNIQSVYESLMRMNQFYISFDEFLNSKVDDVDLCRDFKLNFSNHNLLCGTLKKMVMIDKDGYVKIFKHGKRFNLQFKDRKSATTKLPFAKCYFKSSELIEESNDFMKTYLSDRMKVISEGISRVEVTVKNKKHFESLGYDVVTLRDLLNLTENQKKEIHTKILSKYMKKNVPTKRVNLSPSDRVTLNFITELIERGCSTQEIIIVGLREFEQTDKERRDKSIQKKRIIEFIEIAKQRDEYIKDQLIENDEGFEDVKNVLNEMGVLEGLEAELN